MEVITRKTTRIVEIVKFVVDYDEFEAKVMDSHPLAQNDKLERFVEEKLNRIEVQCVDFEVNGDEVKITAEYLVKYDVETVSKEI